MIVADGHGEKGSGAEASLFAANNYALYLKQALRETAGSSDPVRAAVRLAALRLGRDMKIFASGTTFSAVFIPDDEDMAYVAYAGDSPVRVLDPDGDVIYESKSHNARAMDPSAREAYLKEKGLSLKKGIYFVGPEGDANQLYKAFGDRESAWMDAEPDVDAVPLAEGSTVVLASDGLFMGHDQQMAFLSFGTTARTLVEHAVDHLAEEGLADNATALLYVHHGKRIAASPTAVVSPIAAAAQDPGTLIRPGMKFIDLLNAVKAFREAELPFPLAAFSELNGGREIEDFALENLREGTDLGEDTGWTALWEVLELYETLSAIPGAVRTRLTPVGKGRLALGVAVALESQGSWPGKAKFETNLRLALGQFEEIQRGRFGFQPPEDPGTEAASLGGAGDFAETREVYAWLRSLSLGLRPWPDFRMWLEIKMRVWHWERARRIGASFDAIPRDLLFSDDLRNILSAALKRAGEDPEKWSRQVQDAVFRMRGRAFEAGLHGLRLDLAELQKDFNPDLARERLRAIKAGERENAPEKIMRHRLALNFDRKNGRMLREILADYADRLEEVILIYDRAQIPTKKEMALWRSALPAVVFRREESMRDFSGVSETSYLFTRAQEFSRGLRAPLNVISARVDEIHNETARRLALRAAVAILFLLADILSGLGGEELTGKRRELLSPGAFRQFISSSSGLSFLGDWFVPGIDGTISLALNTFIQSLSTSEESERTLSRAA
jgi:serine/threonine protein phosphatase PrpC